MAKFKFFNMLRLTVIKGKGRKGKGREVLPRMDKERKGHTPYTKNEKERLCWIYKR